MIGLHAYAYLSRMLTLLLFTALISKINRATIYLPPGWPFIVVCSVLRFTEGVGTALYNTAAYTLVNKLYPESVGFIMVRKYILWILRHITSLASSPAGPSQRFSSAC